MLAILAFHVSCVLSCKTQTIVSSHLSGLSISNFHFTGSNKKQNSHCKNKSVLLQLPILHCSSILPKRAWCYIRSQRAMLTAGLIWKLCPPLKGKKKIAQPKNPKKISLIQEESNTGGVCLRYSHLHRAALKGTPKQVCPWNVKLQQQASGRQISPTQATHWDHEGLFWLNFLAKLLRCFLLLEHTQAGPIITTQLHHLPTQILWKQLESKRRKIFFQYFTFSAPEPQSSIFAAVVYNWQLETNIRLHYEIHLYAWKKIQQLHLQPKINYLQIKTSEYRRLKILCLCHFWSQCMLQNLDFLLVPLSTYLLSHCDSVKALNTLTSHSATVNTAHDIRPSTINSKFQALRKSNHLPIYLERPLPVHASIHFGISTRCTALQVTTQFTQGEKSPLHSPFILCQMVYYAMSSEF